MEPCGDWGIQPKKMAPALEGHEVILNNNIAIFNRLKFQTGSGCKAVGIKFKLEVQPILANGQRGDVFLLDSDQTEPFVVITNTKQWIEVVGKILNFKCKNPNT